MDQTEDIQDLGDGLQLRWGRTEDIESVAAFNVKFHSDSDENPDLWLADWTRELMNGQHPTTSASDFTLVVDTKNDNQLVSSCCLISQTWSYAGIPFGCGRPELIATDPAYRRRGLVRQQMAALHAKSSARGELVQAITGIPWFYRQFGYEMTLEYFGSRSFSWLLQGEKWSTKEGELFQMRPAKKKDLPALQTLYESEGRAGLISCVRSEAEWHFLAFVAHRESPDGLHLSVIETEAGETAAYVEFRQWGQSFTVRELAVAPQFGPREIGLFLLNWFKQEAARRNASREQPITHVNFGFGSQHWLYDALDSYLQKPRKPYALYIRVPDEAAFLRHIAPALEARLTASSMGGYSGKLRLNFYRHQLVLIFKDGKLTAVSPYVAKAYDDGDVLFPEHTFFHLLFGHRTLSEVGHLWVDCHARNPEAATLIEILFPKRPSWIRPLG